MPNDSTAGLTREYSRLVAKLDSIERRAAAAAKALEESGLIIDELRTLPRFKRPRKAKPPRGTPKDRLESEILRLRVQYEAAVRFECSAEARLQSVFIGLGAVASRIGPWAEDWDPPPGSWFTPRTPG